MNLKNDFLSTCLSGLFVLAGISVLLVTWFLTPKKLDSGRLSTFGDQVKEAKGYQMRDFRYVSSERNRLQIELFSKYADVGSDSQVIRGKTITCFLFDQQGNKNRILGDRARYTTQEGTLEIEGNVSSTSSDGFELKSDRVIYEVQDRTILSPGKVRGYSQDQTLKVWGDQAKSFLNTNTVNFIGNATTYFKNKKGNLTKIRANQATVRRNDQKVEYDGEVRIIERELRAESKRAELFYESKIKTLKYMVAMDDVKIRQKKGKYTLSQVAEFFAPTDTVVLTGFPSFYDGSDSVTGDRMILYRRTGVVEVTEANAALKDGSGEEVESQTSEDLPEAKAATINEDDKELILEER